MIDKFLLAFWEKQLQLSEEARKLADMKRLIIRKETILLLPTMEGVPFELTASEYFTYKLREAGFDMNEDIHKEISEQDGSIIFWQD